MSGRVPMSTEYSQCQQNALHDSNVSRTTQLHHTSFIECIVYLSFETSQSWHPLLQNVEQRINHTKQSIRHSTNWRKELPIRMLLPLSECQKITYRHRKRTKTKSLKSITAALFQKE